MLSDVKNVYRRNFDDPDEVIELERLESRTLTLGGLSLAYDIHKPGWHWKEHVRPVVGTEWCESRHAGFVISGQVGIRLRDGSEFECRAGDAVDIPPGHDGWVIGDEACVMVSWMGGTTWLAPIRTLKERVLVSLLFTDIVNSTAAVQTLGDQRWGDLLAGYNQRTSDSIDRYRGQFIKHTGDGSLVLFDGAVRALKCALACQRAAVELGLSIRAGVHTGEVEVSEGEVQGLAVHEAQRIMTHANPDDVLVSATTVALARDPGLGFEDQGEFRLKGFEEATTLYRVFES